jgi:hypothetical protein
VFVASSSAPSANTRAIYTRVLVDVRGQLLQQRTFEETPTVNELTKAMDLRGVHIIDSYNYEVLFYNILTKRLVLGRYRLDTNIIDFSD